MTRWSVFRLRLAVSVAALCLLGAMTRLLWYPGGYSALAGVDRLLLTLAAISVVVGPGLTALMYRPGKRGLWIDVTALAALEVAAFGWAGHEIFDRRPAYTVFAVDRFEVAAAREVDPAAAAAAGIPGRPGHTPRLVFAQVPADPAARSKLITEVVLGGMPDIDQRPEFWQPYSAGTAMVLQRAEPLSTLLELADGRERAVQRWLRRRGADSNDYVYLPVQGKRRDATMVLHARVGFPVAIIDIDPW